MLEASEKIQHDVFFSVANVFNLEVDLLFLDTTTTYFEIDGEDDDSDDEDGFRKRGHGKDNHPELAQVVTKTGKLKLDKAKIDGKYLISTYDDGLSAEDVVAGYKRFWNKT